MEVLRALAILRTVSYFAVSTLSIYIGLIYSAGNEKRKKKSKLISRMVHFFYMNGMFFAYLSILPIASLYSEESYLFLTKLLFLLSVPLCLSIIRLWKEVIK